MTGSSNPYDISGPIAEKYDMLQGLPHLRAAHEAYPVPPASHLSTLKAVMQASVIALFNMQDLMARATGDMERGDIKAAAAKREWESRFSRILNDLSRIPERIAIAGGSARHELNIIKHPAFDTYFGALRAFDGAVSQQQDAGNFDLRHAIAEGAMSDPDCRLVQHTRVSSYDALPWERNLRLVRINKALSSEQLSEFMGKEHLYNAVHALAVDTPPLKDATFFNQFRGLHQIPEILVHEQNDHIEQAIKDIHAGRLRQALEHMAIVETLFEPIVASVRNMAETLTTDDYHRFRKHLGLTSGSNSEEIRHRLFIKNYRALWEAVKDIAIGTGAHDKAAQAEMIEDIDTHRHDDDNYYLKHQLLGACQQFRASIMRWKDSHLHLARSTLGSGGTKSLIGSPDAIDAVIHMFEAAHGDHDPMQPLLKARGLDVLPKTYGYGPMEKQLRDEDSFIAQIEKKTGEIARQRFPAVQYRTGIFSRTSHEDSDKNR